MLTHRPSNQSLLRIAQPRWLKPLTGMGGVIAPIAGSGSDNAYSLAPRFAGEGIGQSHERGHCP
ncbi:MAG: hypothetical protein R3E39_18835 [Anaerolineae bacterium]